jgi:hypothetical protein
MINQVWPADNTVGHQHTLMSDCDMSGHYCGNGAISYFANGDPQAPGVAQAYSEHYDIISHGHTTGYGIKIESSYHTIRNYRSYQCEQGMSIATYAEYCKIYGASTYNNPDPGSSGSKCIELSGAHHELAYFLADANYVSNIAAVRIEDYTSKDIYVHDGILKGGVYHPTLSIATEVEAPADLSNKDFVFEDLDISYGSSAGFSMHDSIFNVTFRRCTFHNNPTALNIPSGLVDSVVIENCVFYDNSVVDIKANGATTKLFLYNNTVDGEIDVSSANGEIVRDNLYKVIDTNTGGNIDIDGLTTNDVFIDYSNNDYHLKSTAGAVLDAATNAHITEDKDQNPIYNDVRDIGAYEYTP